MNQPAIILFDGVCNLCNGAVRFIIKRDRHACFQFASLQGITGQRLLAEHKQSSQPNSIILIQSGRAYEKSDAALRICRKLGGAWPVLSILRIVPRPIRDYVYDVVARNRYRWFGKADQCMLPTPELHSRFLPDE